MGIKIKETFSKTMIKVVMKQTLPFKQEKMTPISNSFLK